MQQSSVEAQGQMSHWAVDFLVMSNIKSAVSNVEPRVPSKVTSRVVVQGWVAVMGYLDM
jgi:hypothetical protein